MSKLLIAEDNGFTRDLLSRRLQRAGYEMIPASNGKEAVLAARQNLPDLIILDLEMPVMNGQATIRALKNDPHTFRIPIIVLSAEADPDVVVEAMSAGCYAYETKPVPVRRLIERIEQALHPEARGAAAPG
ncbi:MAG: response regulator [Acidobacteriia bacterium]|nr:response regulator [Terriglobia bacterium]